MNRINRFASLIVLCTIVMLTASCAKLFEPKDKFFGCEVNATQWRLFVTDPSNQGKSWKLDPSDSFTAEVEGSTRIHSTASLPDGTIYAALDAYVNQVSGDAPVNGGTFDWAWIIGGAFYASVTPVPGGGNSANAHVEIINFASQHGVARPVVVMVTPAELASISAAKTHADLISATKSIADHYGLHMSSLMPTTEVK